MRDSCIFYRSFYESIKDLPIEEQAIIYNAIFSYSLDFQLPELKGIAKSIFTLIKPQIDANIKRYNNGTIPKQKQTTSKTEAKPKQDKSEVEANVNVNVNDNVNDNVNVNENENKNVNKKVKNISGNKSPVHPSYGFIKECFLSYYLKEKKDSYYFKPIDGKKINSIIEQLKFKISEKNTRENITLEEDKFPEQINLGFEYLLGNINDDWIKENLSLSIIDSKFNEIISKIINNGKDGKPKRLVDEAGERLRNNQYS